jgi:thioesterase domain-containing protein
MKKKEKNETIGPVTASTAGEKEISRELEDEIYEKRLLAKLDCIEKLNKGRNNKNFFIVHPNHGMLYQYTQLALALEKEFNVYGIQARGLLPRGKMPETPDQMVNDYVGQILKVQKSGTFYVAGFCGGNAVAYEVARRLELRKHEVGTLVLIDSHVFVTDIAYSYLRYKQYYPEFQKKKMMDGSMEAFKSEMRANKFELKDSDDGAFRKKKVEKYMDTLCEHVFYLGFLKAPILVPQAILSPRPVATQERFDRITKSTATLIKVPGTHDGMLEQPDVEKLAEVIINNT